MKVLDMALYNSECIDGLLHQHGLDRLSPDCMTLPKNTAAENAAILDHPYLLVPSRVRL